MEPTAIIIKRLLFCSVKQFSSKLKIYLQLADIDTTMCNV